MLISFFKVLYTNSSWYMSYSASTICFIYFLTPSSRSSHIFKFQVLRIDIEIIRNLWHDDNDSCTRMNSPQLLSFWHSLNFVNSTFMFQMSKYFFPSHLKKTWFAALPNSCINLELLLLPSPAFRSTVILIHLHQILCKQTWLWSSSCMLDFHSTVSKISIVSRDDCFNNFFLHLIKFREQLTLFFYSHIFQFWIIQHFFAPNQPCDSLLHLLVQLMLLRFFCNSFLHSN